VPAVLVAAAAALLGPYREIDRAAW
jgi:hypothetical protein